MTHSVAKQPVEVVDRLTTFSHALLFVSGFSIVFVIGWGGAATLLGQLFDAYKSLLAQVGGVLVILFGLYTLGIINPIWFNYDTRPIFQGRGGESYLSSSLMGVFFAAGWTPCIGTTLGAILTLGISQQTSSQAMVLASGYALGLGLPFLLISLLLDRAFTITRRLQRYHRQIRFLSGFLLLVMGGLLVSNRLFHIAIWAQQNGLYLDPQFGQPGTPSYLIAVLAGLISFLSPCVLPLVPAYIGYLSGRAIDNSKA